MSGGAFEKEKKMSGGAFAHAATRPCEREPWCGWEPWCAHADKARAFHTASKAKASKASKAKAWWGRSERRMRRSSSTRVLEYSELR